MSDKSNLPALQNYLQAKVPHLKALAVSEFKPDTLVSTVLWDLKRQPELARCTPESLLYCVKFAVQHDLELGGTLGQLHMVAFGNQATPIVGYKGIVKLLQKRRQITVEARPVYEKDGFKCDFTTKGIEFEHKPKWTDDRGEMVGVYSLYRDVEGRLLHVEVMTRGEVDKVRRSSKAANSGPWVTWYEEQAKKTVTKRGVKYIALDAQVARTIAEADEIEFGKGPIDVTDEAEVETVATKTEEIKNQLKAKVKAKPEPAPAPEPEPEPPAPESWPEPPATEPPPQEPSAAVANHIADLREQVEEQLAVMDEDMGESVIHRWATGTGKPKNWKWRIHSTKRDLTTIIALLEEERAMAKG